MSTSAFSAFARSPPATSAASPSIAVAAAVHARSIWLQGIWLPLHGYSFERTPLWAGIYMLPLTVGFLIACLISGAVSDRIGSRGIASAGAALSGAAFLGLMVLPVDFSYPVFALLLAVIGAATGMFASPNSSSIMGSVPAGERGVASGMRATFQNSGTAISIGVFFTLVIAGVASSLPAALSSGLIHGGVLAGIAHRLAALPPVSSLFGALLGINPLHHLLAAHGDLHLLSAAGRQAITGRGFFPHLISAPFHNGLVVVFGTAAASRQSRWWPRSPADERLPRQTPKGQHDPRNRPRSHRAARDGLPERDHGTHL